MYGVGSQGLNTGVILPLTYQRAVLWAVPSSLLSSPFIVPLHFSTYPHWWLSFHLVGVTCPEGTFENEIQSPPTAFKALHSLGPSHLLSELPLPSSPLPLYLEYDSPWSMPSWLLFICGLDLDVASSFMTDVVCLQALWLCQYWSLLHCNCALSSPPIRK